MRGEGIIPVMDVGGNNGGFGNGFGNNGDWAWIIILFLIFGNGRGFGNGFGGGGGIGENYVLATDFATIERKLDGINNGICDATFALNNTINQGFFGVQNSLTQGFGGLNTTLLQGNYALSSQLADCCCKTQRAIDGVNYNMAQNTCAITNNATMNTRDIIEAVNTNYRALHDEIVANKIEAKNERIAELTMQLNRADLRASQEAQNAYLLSELKGCPKPAFIVPNPNCCYNYNVQGVCYSNGCSCSAL
jgi:hypothetical protein